MIIKSNINKDTAHDGIIHEPIEKQIFGELQKSEYTLSYKITDKQFVFTIGYCDVTFNIKKGKVVISASPFYSFETGLYSDIQSLEVKLKVNVDVQKDWDKVIDYIDRVNNFQKEFLCLKEIVKPSDSDIQNELGEYFNNDILECSYYSSLCFETNFSFSIKRKGCAPADGAYFNIYGDFGAEIRRGDMDNLVKHFYLDNDIYGLKKRIEIIQYVENKIDAFAIGNFTKALEKYKYTLVLKDLLEKYSIKSRYS